ncbi:MAG TPA: aminoglycoside phosphotransferase family protein [Pirellulales bacterium]|nr:aminoglycoside phosphotransferase family protein [Pirellulales bacterium]
MVQALTNIARRKEFTVTSIKMHADEVDINSNLVRRLIRSQFPEWADLKVVSVPFRGTDNALYRLGSDMVIRLPRRDQSAGRLEKERIWLPKLAPLLPLAVPAALAAGKPGEGYPFDWAIYRWLEGEPGTSARIDADQAATDLATFIATLQRVDLTGGPPPGEHNAWRGVPLAARDQAVRSAIASLGAAIDAHAVTAVWQAGLSARDWERAAVWIHGDLDSRNVLAKEGRLTAVIDFGCLGVGDPACDVMVAWKMFSARSRDTFLTALAVDEATRARARGWVLSQALIALAYYTMETNPVLVRESHRWIAEVLS